MAGRLQVHGRGGRRTPVRPGQRACKVQGRSGGRTVLSTAEGCVRKKKKKLERKEAGEEEGGRRKKAAVGWAWHARD